MRRSRTVPDLPELDLPPPERRRMLLWFIFDDQLDAIKAMDPHERKDPVLTLQRLVGAMGDFGLLGGGDDISAVAKVLNALATMDVIPGLPAIPDYDGEDEEV